MDRFEIVTCRVGHIDPEDETIAAAHQAVVVAVPVREKCCVAESCARGEIPSEAPATGVDSRSSATMAATTAAGNDTDPASTSAG